MNKKAFSERCKWLYQFILGAVESDKVLRSYSVGLSAILTRSISEFERKIQEMMEDDAQQSMNIEQQEEVNDNATDGHNYGNGLITAIENSITINEHGDSTEMVVYDDNLGKTLPSMINDHNKTNAIDQSQENDDDNDGNDINLVQYGDEEIIAQQTHMEHQYAIQTIETIANTTDQSVLDNPMIDCFSIEVQGEVTITTEKIKRKTSVKREYYEHKRRRYVSVDERRFHSDNDRQWISSEKPAPTDTGTATDTVTATATSTSIFVSQAAPQSTKFENAMKKRHSATRKTIATRPLIKQNVEKVELRNTDRNMYPKNNLYRTLCKLCNTNERFLVIHYARQHPSSEVLIARPSSKMADSLRKQNILFEMNKKKISGLCYFCEDKKNIVKAHWATHYLTHTGEQLYFCKDCGKATKTKAKHTDCSKEPLNIYEGNSTDGSLMAYMCIECNYLQVRFDHIVQHVIKQHENSDAVEGEHYEKVTLVPDLSPVKVTNSMQIVFAEPVKRYACTKCNKKSHNVEEFEQHFNDAHANTGEYECFCGEIMSLDGEPLTGNFVSAHLEKHNAVDSYQCKVCDELFFDRTSVNDHLLNEHTESKFKYQHIKRESNQVPTIMEMTITKIICDVCHIQVEDGTFLGALEHFSNEHDSENVDLSGFCSKKITHLAKKVNESKTFYCGGNTFKLKF